MESNWRDRKREVPSAVASLYSDAKLNGAWIYHIPTRRYYTPDEFMENWFVVFQQNRSKNNRNEFQIMNPMAAIRQRAEWVTKANAELQEIMRKLESYNASFKIK